LIPLRREWEEGPIPEAEKRRRKKKEQTDHLPVRAFQKKERRKKKKKKGTRDVTFILARALRGNNPQGGARDAFPSRKRKEGKENDAAGSFMSVRGRGGSISCRHPRKS